MTQEQFERFLRFCGSIDDHFRRIADSMELIAGGEKLEINGVHSNFSILANGVMGIAEEMQASNEMKTKPKTKTKGKRK